MYLNAIPQNKVLPTRCLPAINRRRRLAIGSKRQQRFLLSVKLLLKSLQASQRPLDRLLAQQVKNTVRECVRQNRAGDKTAVTLQTKLEARIRDIVGHEMYVRSTFLVDFYQARRMLRH